MEEDDNETPGIGAEGRRLVRERTNETERLVLRLAKTSSLGAVLALTLTTAPTLAGRFGPFVFRMDKGDVTLDWADLHSVERNLMERRLTLLIAGAPFPPERSSSSMSTTGLR